MCTSRWLTSELCRKKLREIVKTRYDELESSGSNAILPTDPRAIYTNPPSRSSRIAVLPRGTNCSIPSIIPPSYQICIAANYKALPKMDWEKRSYGVVFKYPKPTSMENIDSNDPSSNSNNSGGKELTNPENLLDLVVEFRTYPIPAGMHNPEASEHLGEVLIFPFHKWVEGGITVEKTWWFKSGFGSRGYVQLAKGHANKGHAFFHSYGGFWA